MFFEPRIGLKSLAALCRRLATSLSAGVDVRAIFAREAKTVRGFGHSRLEHIRAEVADGSSISDALDGTGEYFPEFLRSMVRVGEETGTLAEVFKRLAEHFEHQLSMRRALVKSITWPMMELGLALAFVGFMIWLRGAIPALSRPEADVLGIGLSGTSGLITYLVFLALVAAGVWMAFAAAKRGALWIAPVQQAVYSLPALGHALQTIALSQLTWVLHVTLNTAMDVRQALKLALDSTQSSYYTRHTKAVQASIRRGDEVHEAFRNTGAFPADFLDMVQVGEESGSLSESMGHLSGQYHEQARTAMQFLSTILGYCVSALIFGIIIYFIFKGIGFYTNTINNLSRPGAF